MTSVPRLEVGDLIRTRHGQAVLRIQYIDRECRCGAYSKTQNMRPAPPREKHLNLICEVMNGSGKKIILDGYLESTLRHINGHDYITKLPQDHKVQLTFL